MPKVPKGKRKRAYKPKTRTGCPTCKLRRVKCDETKPACNRCTSTGRICDGYPLVEFQSPSQQLVKIPIVANPDFGIHLHDTTESRRSYAYFMQRTSPQQAGFFGSEFWEKLVFRAAYHEKAVRHAVIAIGALQETCDGRTAIINSQKIFALNQYNLAIKDLLAPAPRTQKRSIGVCLISCLLFTCFEGIQGNHMMAGSHLQSGAKLLREVLYDQRDGQDQLLKLKNDRECFGSLESIARIFAIVDPEINLIIGTSTARTYERLFLNGNLNNPISFSSVGEARALFEYGAELYITGRDTTTIDPTVEMFDKYSCLAQVMRFKVGLDDFRKEHGASLTPKDDISLAILQVHLISSCLALHIENPYGETRKLSKWEDFMPMVLEMVAHAEKIFSSDSTALNQGEGVRFSLGTGIVAPLLTMARYCRDPIISRKLIVLLRSTPRQEGLLNSFAVADLIERVMEVEKTTTSNVDAFRVDYSNTIDPGQPQIEDVGLRNGTHLTRERFNHLSTPAIRVATAYLSSSPSL